MAIVQSIAKRYFSAGSPDAAAFASPTTAGNAILVAVNLYNGGGAGDITVSDDSTNTYGNDKSSAANARTMFFLAANIAGKASQTVTLTPTSSDGTFWQAWELSEVPTSSLQATSVVFYVDSDSNPNPSVTSGTPSQSGNIVFVSCGSRENFGAFALTSPAGYTVDHLDTSTGSLSSSMAHKTGSGSAQSASWTCNTGAAGSAGIIVIKQNTTSGIVLLRRRHGLSS